eukprot:UN01353
MLLVQIIIIFFKLCLFIFSFPAWFLYCLIFRLPVRSIRNIKAIFRPIFCPDDYVCLFRTFSILTGFLVAVGIYVLYNSFQTNSPLLSLDI